MEVPKHPDDWNKRDLLGATLAMSRNPVEATTFASMTLEHYITTAFGETILALGSPDLIKYLFVDNHKNMEMHPVRQAILKPVLKDGLITAEGEAWRFARRALAPVFVPRHTKKFATKMRTSTQALLHCFPEKLKAQQMTLYAILRAFLMRLGKPTHLI